MPIRRFRAICATKTRFARRCNEPNPAIPRLFLEITSQNLTKLFSSCIYILYSCLFASIVIIVYTFCHLLLVVNELYQCHPIMRCSVAILLDHDGPSRAEIMALLHTWSCPVLATTNPKLATRYLHDRRVTLCIANTAFLSVSQHDLATMYAALLPHQMLILAGSCAALPIPVPSSLTSQIINVSYPIPIVKLQPIISLMLNSCHENARLQGPFNQPVRQADNEFTLDVALRRLRLHDREIRLSKDELKLVQYLYEAKGRICRYEDLARLIFPPHYDEAEARHLLRGRMYYLQTKIERDPKNPKYLVCERGLGYQLRLPGVLKYYGA